MNNKTEKIDERIERKEKEIEERTYKEIEEKAYNEIEKVREKEANIILKMLIIAVFLSLLLLPIMIGFLGNIAWTIYFILMFSNFFWFAIEIFRKEEKIFELKEKIGKIIH